MSQFQPTSFSVSPRHQPDDLADALLNALARRLDNKHNAWSLPRTVVVSVLTFGVWPVFTWQRKLRDFVTQEQSQLWHLAEWLRLQTGRADAQKLRDDSQKLRWSHLLSAGAVLSAAAVVITFAAIFAGHRDVFQNLVGVTWKYPAHRGWMSPELVKALFLVWTGGLGLAYVLHWIQVTYHATQLRNYLRAFNAIAESENIPPVPVPDTELGVRPLWLIAAVPFAAVGAVWAVPMMLAGAAQRRYIKAMSTPARRELAYRVRGMLTLRRPALNVVTPATLRRRCENEKCLAHVSASAVFCPRCGSRLKAALERVA